MSLEQGVRYNIVAVVSPSPKRTNYNTVNASGNRVERNQGILLKNAPLNTYSFSIATVGAKQIDYILEAKDFNSGFVPDVFLTSGTIFNSETLTGFTGDQSSLADMAKAGHDGISFFGADQTTFSNIKYNETLSGIENDTMYILSSNCAVTYNGTEYKYGDFFSVAADANEPEIAFTKTGAPLFIEVLNNGTAESSQKYYVYGSQGAISDEESVQVGSSIFYPGDVFTGVAGSITVASGVTICLIKISGENLRQWFSETYSSGTITAHETDEKTYLIYDNISCLYNSSLVKPNLLLNNVFKTTLDSVYDQPGKMEWLNTSGDRKKPIIREIIKSSAVKPGEEYHLFHDEFTGFGRSNTIKYNDIQYNTVIKPGDSGTSKQPVFRGINLKTTYSTGYKNLDKQDAHIDPDYEDKELQARNLDLASGNPMVLKKEPIGLKAGQKYVFVAEPIADIEEDEYYMLSKGKYITYNNSTISIGQVFKGISGKISWETVPKEPPSPVYSDGEEEITLVTNSVKVNTLENENSENEATLTTTIKNRKVEFTASDDDTLADSSPILYWTNDSGKPYIYKSVDTLEENKRYYVAAEGDGFVSYPPEDLMYSCIRSDRKVESGVGAVSNLLGTKLTKAEIETQKDDETSNYSVCVNAGGEWVPETENLTKDTKRYHNRGSFYAIKGKCNYGPGDRFGERLWGKNTKDSCDDSIQAEIDAIYDSGTAAEKTAIDEEAISTVWTPHLTFNEKKDTLLAYAITENSEDQSLVHEVVFKEEASSSNDTLPDDTKTPDSSPRAYAVAPLKQKLSQYQVLRFPQQSANKSEPTFIVAKDYGILDENNDPTVSIEGWLLYEKIPAYTNDSTDLANRTATASLAVDKTTDGASSINPFNLYYAEPLELKIETEASEGDATITLYSLPCSLIVGEFLNFKDSNGKISQFKVTAAAQASTSQTIVTGSIMCPESSENKIAVDSTAKAYGKKVGTYCLNKKFNRNQRFSGISSKPIVRFKDRRTITTTLEENSGALAIDLGNWSNSENTETWKIEQTASANASIHKVVVKEATASTPTEEVGYSIGGRGFVNVGSSSYYGTVSGRITINHPKAGTSLDKYNKSKFPWYEDKYVSVNQEGRIQSVQIFQASTHVPSGTKLYFPNAVLELTLNLELGSTTMTGRFVNQVPDRGINLSPKRLHHDDESNFVYIEGQTVDFSGGTKEVLTDSNTFLYKTTAETKYRDANGTGNSRKSEASGGRFSIATAGQEYYVKVTPEEITSKEVDSSKYPIEEGLEYTVKATGETIELASSYDPANTEASTGLYPADREQTLGIVSELKEALPINTVLTFYPADQVRSLQGNPGFEVDKYVSVHREYEGRTPYDPELTQKDRMMGDAIPAKTGGIRFTLTEAAGIGDESIKGKVEKKGRDKEWGGSVLKGAELTTGAIAEAHRAIVYNDKVFRAGETFAGTKKTYTNKIACEAADGTWDSENNTCSIDLGRYTQYSNSFLNSTKNEKIYAYNAYVDYFYEEDIFSGGEFNINLDKVLKQDDKDSFVRGEINGSESEFEFNGAQINYQFQLVDDDRRKHFYYLPPSPTLNLSVSSAKIYKIDYKYISPTENKYTFTLGVTYKVGGTGDGYIDTVSNTVGEDSDELSGEKTFYPSSPSVYDKTPTSLEPSKFYILEYPETFPDGSYVDEPIKNLSTLKYNSEKYFSHNYDFIDMEESIKIKYFSSEYVLRYPMLNSYVFGRSEEQFVQNVRNFNENLGKPNFQKIHETYKRINGAEKYPDSGGTVLWESGLISFNRYFDILDNSFESFNILRKEKYYNQWNKFKLAEQDIEGVRTFVNIDDAADTPRRDYEHSLAHGIRGTAEFGYLPNITAGPFIRLVDSELLPSTVSDLTYRVESSQESYFSAPDASGIEAVRTLQPRPENRLKANNRYYLTGGSIKYLGYDDGVLKSVNGDTSTTIAADKIFTGKADYFDNDYERIFYGNESNYKNASDIVPVVNNEDNVIENRLGTFEFWNYVTGAPLVYPIIEQWEVEANKIYEIAGSASVDRVEYEGKVYKPGETFKGKQLSFDQPLSGDQDMFVEMLSPDDYKGAAARGLRPWMDDSYYNPRERGYIPLTPLIYRTISSGDIKANVKYIVTGSGSIKYPDNTDTVYNAKNAIAYPDNHFDATLATAYAANVRRKVRQNEKIETAEAYFVYGAGKVKYIRQVKVSVQHANQAACEAAGGTWDSGDSVCFYADGASSVNISAGAGVVLPIYSVLEFSNGSTFVLTEEADEDDTTLNGTLSGDLKDGDVAPVTINKSNKQVEILNDYNAGASEIEIKVKALPFNIPKGEVLYFTDGTTAKGKLTVSENALAGAVTIDGLLENADLTLGDKANIVYAREHVYKEYIADGEFGKSFTGLRGYDYFEITEGNPEIYTDENLTTTIGERYYVFGTSNITHDGNSVSPSNVFYGKESETEFHIESGSPAIVEIVEPENLEVDVTYTIHGNGNNLFDYNETAKTNDEDFLWAEGNVITEHKDLSGVQDPSGPIIYSKTLKIISPGQTYKVESLGDSAPRGVVKYVEKVGECSNPTGTLISSIKNAQDCLLEDTVRANLSRKALEGNPTTKYGSYAITQVADTGVQGYSAGNYKTSGVDFEIYINDFTKYEPTTSDISSFEAKDEQGNTVTYSQGTGSYPTHTVTKYKIISINSTIMFFNGGVLVASEDIWIEGKYTKPTTDQFETSRIGLYEYDQDTCVTDGGIWDADQDSDNYFQCIISGLPYSNSVYSEAGGTSVYNRLNKGKWISVVIKGDIVEPVSIKHNEEAPLFSWKEDPQTAYFTTDGNSYTAGSITTIKKSKNGEIKPSNTDPPAYTLAGGVEISYNGATIKRGERFNGVSDSSFASIGEDECTELGGTWDSGCSKDLSEWKLTKNSDGTEYLTSAGSETEFTGLPNYDEVEIVSGNPQIFIKGESFLIPEGGSDETYTLEGEGEIKVLGNEKISNLSEIKYSGVGNNEADLFAKTGAVETIKPRGVIPPTNLQTGYQAGTFTGVNGSTTYKVRTQGWDSVAWVYHKLGAIRSAKMRTDAQWGTTVDLINDESFTFNSENGETVLEPTSSTFLNSGITEAEDYIDVNINSYFDGSSYELKKNAGVLVFEGFKIPFAAKRLFSFPGVIPYSAKDRSEFVTTSDIKQSRLFNLFASRIAVGKDAVVFGKGEVAIYDYDDLNDDSGSPTLKSTTFIKAYSNLKVSSGNTEGASVTSLTKDYRYIVTSGSGSVKKSAIKIHNTNGFHNKEPDGTTQAIFGTTDSAYDFFKNEAGNGIKFKTLGRQSMATLTGATFDSTIGFKESYSAGTYDEDNVNNSFIEVSALPVNLEEGEILKTSNAELTLSERALKGATKIKGTVVGTLSGSVRRRVKVAVENIFGSSSEQIAGTFDAYDDTTSGNIINCPTSLTDDQASTAITGVDDDLSVSAGSRFTAIMDSSFPDGVTVVSYSNVVPKTFFEITAADPNPNNDYITNPRVEYLQGDPKFLFIVDGVIPESDVYDGEEGLGLPIPTSYRYHLYDVDYSTVNQATIKIVDGDGATVDGTIKTAKNNFFIHDGSVDTFTLLSTKIKNNLNQSLTSKIYIYKEVLSGEIEQDKEYLVYGTGSVEYSDLEITAVNDFVTVTSDKGEDRTLAFNCFTGVANVAGFRVRPYQETFWNIYDTDYTASVPASSANTDIPIRDRIRRASAPRVFELVYFSYYEDGQAAFKDGEESESISLNGSAGDIYYVYGEGGITYGIKKIYATNKYIAVGGQNYDDTSGSASSISNKLEPSNAVYAGRIHQTIGHEYEYNKDGIINPIPKHHFFAENKYTMGNTEEIFISETNGNINRDRDVVLYRKTHALDQIKEGEEYKIFSSVQGEGKSGVNSAGGVPGYVTNSDVVLNSIEYDAESKSPGGEVVSGEQTKNSGEITISSTEPSDNVSTKTLSNKPKLIVSRKRLSQMKRKGVFSGIRLDKCLNCVVDGNAWYIGESTKVVRSQVEFYDTLYGAPDVAVTSGEAIKTEASEEKPYQVGKPKGLTYVVRGSGSIRYPVKGNGADIVVGGKTLTRVIPKGESFTPIENETYLGRGYGYYKKKTGQETVYRIADPEDSADYWKGLDRFAGMAPDRQGTPDGEIKEGITYRVLKYEAPERISKLGAGAQQLKGIFYIRGAENDDTSEQTGSLTYDKIPYAVGKKFVGASGAKSVTSISTGVFFREESGTYGNAPEGDWSNQWSMFMSQTVTSPSTTSLWHHDVYGDVLGFLNNRCHFYSLDFQSNKYSHLLQTFAYGIKPVIRSEAPSGYTYLEGSNAKQSWFAEAWLAPFIYDYSSGQAKDVETDEFQDYLNMLYYKSCQIYKPDYPIDTVTCIDLGQNINESTKLKPEGSYVMQNGICIKSGKTKTVKDADACAEIEGTWYPLKDMVEVTLNRRLDHRPNTTKIKKNMSQYSLSYIKRLHKALSPGPFNPESYRTDENAVIEYLIKQRRWKHTQLSTKEEPYFVSNSCHKSRIGDSGPDISAWYHPDDPWGACDSRFYFTKQIPYAHDSNDERTVDNKTPIELKTFQQMEFYLRAMCGGFIDKESNPKPLEYGGIEPGLLPSSVPVCVMSKDYEYLFENLAYQALDETNESITVENYKTIEMWHDSSDLRIKRLRKARVRRTFKSASEAGGLRMIAVPNNYYEIYRGSISEVSIERQVSPGNSLNSIATYVPDSDTERFSDDYYETLQDDWKASSNKKFRIPMTQNYVAVIRDSSFTTVSTTSISVGLSGTAIVEDFQSEAEIQWDVNPAALYYVLERKKSKMPHYSEWAQVSAVRDVDVLSQFSESQAVKSWTVHMSPTQFEKIEFRVKVFYKEGQLSSRRSRIIEASSNEEGVSSPITVHPYPIDEDFSSENTRMMEVEGASFSGGYVSTATESFSDAIRNYKIKIIHHPSLWLGNQRATTLDGKSRLFYRIEFRILSSYPDGEGQEGDWETVARFDNPATSKIYYTDSEDYSFENVSYRVAYVKDRLGGLRWISPLLRDDRMGKPNDPKGYGPLQNVKLRAALFNQFANAINLLNEVRIDLPISVRTKDIISEWVTPVTEVANHEEGGLVSYWDNPEMPTWGIYAKGKHAKGPHHTFVNWSEHGDELSLGDNSNGGEYFIGTEEGDEYVESGWFSVCAGKGFGFSRRPWVQGGSAYTALIYQDWRVLVTVPNDQVAMRNAIPSRFRDMFWGKHVVLSGLNEHEANADVFSEWPHSYVTTKHFSDYPAAAEDMVFCRSEDETGLSRFGEAIYDFMVSTDQQYIKQPNEQRHFYRSWCGMVPGMALLVAPPMPPSDNAIFITPMGVQAGSDTSLVCTPGGAASTHCFTTRAGTGDNNMSLTVEVLDSVGSKPFNSPKKQTGRYYMMLINMYYINAKTS